MIDNNVDYLVQIRHKCELWSVQITNHKKDGGTFEWNLEQMQFTLLISLLPCSNYFMIAIYIVRFFIDLNVFTFTMINILIVLRFDCFNTFFGGLIALIHFLVFILQIFYQIHKLNRIHFKLDSMTITKNKSLFHKANYHLLHSFNEFQNKGTSKNYVDYFFTYFDYLVPTHFWLTFLLNKRVK